MGNTALQFPAALTHFFSALQQREQQPGNTTVRILQWGDSHTAADMFTGEARARMQARFGDGGVGFTYAGHPFAGYRILGSGRGQSGAWQTLGTHFTELGDAELGLGGVAIQSSRAGDTASLDAPCLTLDIDFLRQPNGGSFQLADNGFPIQTVSTATPNGNAPANDIAQGSGADAPAIPPDTAVDPDHPDTPDNSGSPDSGSPDSDNPDSGSPDSVNPDDPGTPNASTQGLATPNRAISHSQGVNTPGSAATTAGTFHYDCAAGSHHFTLTTQGGPVRLLGTTALQPGLSWEAMGINGAEAPLLLRWNQPLFRGYLAAAAPDLIVLAYGTNEAAARPSAEDYRATFARLIETLHRTAPLASVLVLGPGDRSLGYTAVTYTGRGRHRRRIEHRYYVPYTGTDRILNVQRDVCRTHNCAFWDWRARQGGFGSMNRWAAAGLAQPDHTHFTGPGYRALADALVADLLSAYSNYDQPASTN